MKIAARVTKGLGPVVVAILLPLAILSMHRGVKNALGVTSSGFSIDLYSYWNPARLLLDGADPYSAVLSGDLTASGDLGEGQGQEDLVSVPANAPLMLVLLSPLALVPWPVARVIWAAVNTVLALILPVLALGLLRRKQSLWFQASICLAFYAMLPTRNAISNGQTTLLVFAAALLAITLAPKNQWLAGILFGVALSKYSLVLPLALWFLAFGFARTLATALALQSIGVLIPAILTGTSPIILLLEYSRIAISHNDRLGDLDLPSLFGRWGIPAFLGIAASVAGAAISCAVLWRWYRVFRGHDRAADHASNEAADRVLLLAALFVTTLPFVYHRVYDAVVLIVLPIAWLAIETGEGGGSREKISLDWGIVRVVSTLILGVFLLPRVSAISYFPQWDQLYSTLTAIAALFAWGIVLVLLETQLRRPAFAQSDTKSPPGS